MAEPVDTAAPGLRRPRLMRQSWRSLTFVHWAIDPARVAAMMPPGVRPDELDGVTYVGLVAFSMVDAGFAHGPAVPWLGSFLETNVRLYSVDETGRRGIVFLSLDTDRLAVVAGARSVFGLPYRWARMRYERRGDVHAYRARLRPPHRGHGALSVLRVRVSGERADQIPAGQRRLEDFLTARWGLHVAHLGRTWYVPNAHPPWTLRQTELLDLDDDLLASVGLPGVSSRPPDQLGFSDGVHTEFAWPSSAATPRRHGSP